MAARFDKDVRALDAQAPPDDIGLNGRLSVRALPGTRCRPAGSINEGKTVPDGEFSDPLELSPAPSRHRAAPLREGPPGMVRGALAGTYSRSSAYEPMASAMSAWAQNRWYVNTGAAPSAR